MRSLVATLALGLAVGLAPRVAAADDPPAAGGAEGEPEIEITDDAPADAAPGKPAEKPTDKAKAAREAKKKEKERSKLVKAGDGMFSKGDYQGALTKYQQAYDVLPSPLLYYPMAKAEEKLVRPLDAIAHYEQFLAEGEGIINEDLKADAEVSVQELDKTIAKVTLDVRPPGATVSVDDVELGEAPLAKPVRLMPGTHKLTVGLSGYKPVERTLELNAGDTPTEKVRLEEDRPAVVIKEEHPKAVRPAGKAAGGKGDKATMLWVGAGATVACGLGWAITGSMALSDHDTFTDPNQPNADRLSARDDGKTLAFTSDMLLIGTAVSAGFTAYWYYAVYTAPESAPTEHMDKDAPPPVPGGDDDESSMVVPYASPGGAGVAVVGTF